MFGEQQVWFWLLMTVKSNLTHMERTMGDNRIATTLLPACAALASAWHTVSAVEQRASRGMGRGGTAVPHEGTWSHLCRQGPSDLLASSLLLLVF